MKVVPIEQRRRGIGRQSQGMHGERAEHVRLARARNSSVADSREDGARDYSVVKLKRVPALKHRRVELGLSNYLLQRPLELGDLQEYVGRRRRGIRLSLKAPDLVPDAWQVQNASGRAPICPIRAPRIPLTTRQTRAK